MTATHSVLVCDDHPIFRDGVVHCLRQIPQVAVVAEASDVESAIAKLQLYEPDILVCDLSIRGGSGFDVLAWVAARKLDIRVIVLSMHTELQYVQKARKLGAAAFLAKEDAETDLFQAVTHPRDSFYTSDSIGRSSADLVLPLPPVDDLLRKISPAESRILLLLSDSMTSKEIAAALNISPKTVEAHRFRLAEKLDAKGPNKLLEWAIKYRHILRRHAGS